MEDLTPITLLHRRYSRFTIYIGHFGPACCHRFLHYTIPTFLFFFHKKEKDLLLHPRTLDDGKNIVADNLYKAEITKEALFFSTSGFIINPLFFHSGKYYCSK